MAFSRRVEEEIVGISVGYQWEISGKSLEISWKSVGNHYHLDMI